MYEDKIQNGMKWLDEIMPGWERKIDLERLQLKDCGLCVLGQVFHEEAASGVGWVRAGYNWAKREFGLRYDFLRESGFSFINSVDNEDWDVLTEEWGQAIKDRFDSGLLSDER